MVEQTPTNQNSDANISIIRLADAIAGNATQQRPQAAQISIYKYINFRWEKREI